MKTGKRPMSKLSQERYRKKRTILGKVEEAQKWTERKSWRHLCRSQSMRVERIQGRRKKKYSCLK
jgi:hypothetical protein